MKLLLLRIKVACLLLDIRCAARPTMRTRPTQKIDWLNLLCLCVIFIYERERRERERM